MLGGQNRKRSYVCIPVGYLYNGHGDDVTDSACHQMDTQFSRSGRLFICCIVHKICICSDAGSESLRPWR